MVWVTCEHLTRDVLRDELDRCLLCAIPSLAVGNDVIPAPAEPAEAPTEPEVEPNPLRAKLELLRAGHAARCRASFRAFVEHLWPVASPTRELLPSTAVDGICAALQEAAERGGRWAINCPPGVSKSILTAVLFPAWLLLRSHGRERVMLGSYSWAFATRDARRCRDVVESERYQDLVRRDPEGSWSLRADSKSVDDYWTTEGGRRLITSIGGKATGERVGVQVIDDPLNASDYPSDAARAEAAQWVTQVLPSRLDSIATSTRIVVGQRLGADDVFAHLGDGWRRVVLPALATDAPCEIRRDDGTLVWRDPRQVGEPLFRDLDAAAIQQLRTDGMSSSTIETQYQQSPESAAGDVFRREWFRTRWTRDPRRVREGVVLLPARFERVVVAVDASFKEGPSSDFAVAQAWGAAGGRRYLLEQWRRRAGFVDTEAAVADMARRYPFAKVLIEDAANGTAIIDQLGRKVAGVVGVKPEGGKVARAMSVQGIVESGAVVLPLEEDAPWIERGPTPADQGWLPEVCAFPGGKHDDQLDAAVHALRDLQDGAYRLAPYPI